MSFRELKVLTKDIDLITLSRPDFNIIDKAVSTAGYRRATDLEDEFYLTALSVYWKDESRIDVFLNKVGKMLTFSKDMRQRVKLYKAYGELKVYVAAPEDIFIFKSMTTRIGDITDCVTLIDAGLDWNIAYEEIKEQSKGEYKWFFWTFEKLCKIEEEHNINVALKRKVYRLVKSHWNEKPEDFMADVKNKEKHIPDKKLLREIK